MSRAYKLIAFFILHSVQYITAGLRNSLGETKK